MFLNHFILKIEKSTINILKELYGEKVKQFLLDEDLGEHLDEFELVDADVFEDIQREQLKKIIVQSKAKSIKLFKQKISLKDINVEVVNPYFTKHNVKSQIEEFNNEIKKNKEEKSNFLTLIVISILALIIASFTFKDLPLNLLKNILTVFIYGIIFYIKMKK